MGINRIVVQGAGIALILIGASANADEADEVRKAIMGHEAFMQRCGEDVQQIVIEESEEFDANKSYEPFGRMLCEPYYEKSNVCVEGGTVKVVEKLKRMMARANEKLTDPLTPADEYTAVIVATRTIENELAALDDLVSGRTNYCDVE